MGSHPRSRALASSLTTIISSYLRPSLLFASFCCLYLRRHFISPLVQAKHWKSPLCQHTALLPRYNRDTWYCTHHFVVNIAFQYHDCFIIISFQHYHHIISILFQYHSNINSTSNNNSLQIYFSGIVSQSLSEFIYLDILFEHTSIPISYQ